MRIKHRARALFAQAVEFASAVTFSGGRKDPAVLVTDAATYTVLAANSGKLHVVPDLTADITITLPAVEDGLRYDFVYGGAAADAQDWLIDTGADANYFVGGVTFMDLDTDVLAPVYADGDSNSKMTVLVPEVGTHITLLCNGTTWYLSGVVASATVPTFGDQ